MNRSARLFALLLGVGSLLFAAGCGSGAMSREDVEDQLREQLQSEDPAEVKKSLDRFAMETNIPDDMVPTVLDLITKSNDRSVRVRAAQVIRYAKKPDVANTVHQLSQQEADPQIREALEDSFLRMSGDYPAAG